MIVFITLPEGPWYFIVTIVFLITGIDTAVKNTNIFLNLEVTTLSVFVTIFYKPEYATKSPMSSPE